MHQFIANLPKIEPHLHIEGSLEPELMFTLAEHNGLDIPHGSHAAVKAVYDFFYNAQYLSDVYVQGAQVLLAQADVDDLTLAYMLRCQADDV